MPIMVIVRIYNLPLCLSWISSNVAWQVNLSQNFLGEGRGSKWKFRLLNWLFQLKTEAINIFRINYVSGNKLQWMLQMLSDNELILGSIYERLKCKFLAIKIV